MTDKTDIVERLRHVVPYVEQQPPVQYEVAAATAMREAADEIERLRTALLNIANMPANPRYDWYELVEEMASTARRAALAEKEGGE